MNDSSTPARDPYVPIACAAHDELLARATLRRDCELVFRDEAGRLQRVRGHIVDVYTSEGAEFLTLHDGRTIRLDRLSRVDDILITAADGITEG